VALVGLAMVSLGLPAQAVRLRYAPKVGTVSTYMVSTSARTQATSVSLPAPKHSQYTSVSAEQVKVLGVTPSGCKVQSSVGGSPAWQAISGQGTKKLAKPASTMVADYDTRGRLLRVVSTSARWREREAGGISADNTLYALGVIPFPAGEVNPGATWTDQIRIPLLLGAPLTDMNATVRLLAVAPYRGRPCAKLRVTYRGPYFVTAPGPNGEQASASGTTECTVTAYYDYVNCIWVDGSGKSVTAANMTIAREAGGPGVDLNVVTVTNFKMTLVK